MEILFWAVPTLGVNIWRMETFSGTLITNTNDGTSDGFQAVAQLEVLVQAERAPPQTTIPVRLKVTTQDAGARAPELLLVAPPGFTFPEDCGDICTSRGLTFGTSGRITATLMSLLAENLLIAEIVFETITPTQTPIDVRWIVEAQGLGAKVGWGSTQGFKVDQMSGAAAYYGGVAGLKNARLVMTFTLRQEAGERLITTVEVLAPQNFTLFCQEGQLAAISLPGGPPECDLDGGERMRLSLETTLTKETYSFALLATLPAKTPRPNTFAVIIRERATDVVIDAAFNVPGVPLLPLPLTQPSIAWSTASFGEVSSVTVGFTFRSGVDLVRSLIVVLPEGFQQNVRTPADIKTTNVRLPLAKSAGGWVDSSMPRQLRVLLEPSDAAIAKGSYRLTFPVRMPESAAGVPRVNLWRLLFCGAGGGCASHVDPSTLVACALVGFVPGEVSVLEEQRLAAQQRGRKDTSGTMRLEAHGVANLMLAAVLSAAAAVSGVPPTRCREVSSKLLGL